MITNTSSTQNERDLGDTIGVHVYLDLPSPPKKDFMGEVLILHKTLRDI